MPPCNPESGFSKIQVPLNNLGDCESLDLFHGATVTGKRLKEERIRPRKQIRRDDKVVVIAVSAFEYRTDEHDAPSRGGCQVTVQATC